MPGFSMADAYTQVVEKIRIVVCGMCVVDLESSRAGILMLSGNGTHCKVADMMVCIDGAIVLDRVAHSLECRR